MKEEIARTKIEMGETAATIICEEKFVCAAIEGIAKARAEIREYARTRKDFLLSLEPLPCPEDASLTVRRMCDASSRAGVGPMASVAGAIALSGLERAIKEGATHCIIDNGGDIAMVLDRAVTIGILQDIDSASLPAVELGPTNGEIRGLCTSSGVFGHSISFGKAKAATVMAVDPVLADAAATALGNRCVSAEQTAYALESISAIEGICWALAIVGEKVGTLGDIPRLTFGKARKESITVHSRFPSCASIT
ncbi:MAG: UPF0280 family protein [Thermoplasmata archaeon]